MVTGGGSLDEPDGFASIVEILAADEVSLVSDSVRLAFNLRRLGCNSIPESSAVAVVSDVVVAVVGAVVIACLSSPEIVAGAFSVCSERIDGDKLIEFASTVTATGEVVWASCSSGTIGEVPRLGAPLLLLPHLLDERKTLVWGDFCSSTVIVSELAFCGDFGELGWLDAGGDSSEGTTYGNAVWWCDRLPFLPFVLVPVSASVVGITIFNGGTLGTPPGLSALDGPEPPDLSSSLSGFGLEASLLPKKISKYFTFNPIKLMYMTYYVICLVRYWLLWH